MTVVCDSSAPHSPSYLSHNSATVGCQLQPSAVVSRIMMWLYSHCCSHQRNAQNKPC
jgi:hypothetical protein